MKETVVCPEMILEPCAPLAEATAESNFKQIAGANAAAYALCAVKQQWAVDCYRATQKKGKK